MHILWAVVLIAGAIVLLVAGLASILNDLVGGRYNAVPLIKDDLAWPRRYQGSTASTEAVRQFSDERRLSG